MRLIQFAIYLGIGAMLHALTIGPQFDWSSAWTFGWLLGWPIMLFIWFWALMLGLVAVAAAIGIGVWLYDMTFAWRTKRQIKSILAKRRAKA
jgi:hypothetical protein